MAPIRRAIQGQATEWSFQSGKAYADPFNDIELDVVFRDGEGRQWRVPAFWGGENEWRVRFSPPHPGKYTFQTSCTDADNSDLHDQAGRMTATKYVGRNKLLLHGPLRVSKDRRRLEHADGTPFFWLGDTWWMGLCNRLEWPEDFQLLAADRASLGFTVIQIIAGLYPDMPPFDPRGANEAGYPWERNYARINPAYFDMADLRMRWLVKSGLVPCIVGCWGYFLPWMGVAKLKQHWRNIIARYGSYPVVWCLAGEATMAYYLSKKREEDKAMQKSGWTEIARYVRAIDPCHHPVTIHPTQVGRDQLEDPSLLDLDMLQTGHSDRESVPNTVKTVTDCLGREPRMPVLVGEVCYEGILEASRPEIQRFMFWSCILSGAAGHTYGANGIWQVNTRAKPFGPSPHGRSWGNTPWEDAYRLPGSRHIALAKRILERYEWWRFESHPEWVEPHWTAENYFQPYAAGIPGKVRVIFLPSSRSVVVKKIEAGSPYKARFIDPKDGHEYPAGKALPNADGDWQVPPSPIFQDWVLVLDRR